MQIRGLVALGLGMCFLQSCNCTTPVIYKEMPELDVRELPNPLSGEYKIDKLPVPDLSKGGLEPKWLGTR